MSDRYTHGHHPAVLRSHTWRTAENSAGFLLSSLIPGRTLLDVGCGPGTISADLAARLAPGLVTAIDRSSDVIDLARATHAAANLRFQVGDVYGLDFGDETFDVVYAHQVLQHLTRPVEALTEMRRVLRGGGLVALREADFGSFLWYPEDERMDRWLALYFEVTAVNGADPQAGRRLASWCQAAGFDELVVTSSNWTFHSESERAWWGGLWAERVRDSDFARQALEYELSTVDELASISDAFLAWSRHDDGLFIVPNVEVLATR